MRPASDHLPALRRALGPWRALLLVALLLAAQAAGLAHRVAHGPQAHGGPQHALHWGHAAPGGPSAHTHPAEHAQAPLPAGEHTHTGAGSEAGAECRLYDQLLGHADALFGPAGVDALPLSAVAASLPPQSSHRRSPAAAFQARAPPLA